MQEPDGSMRMIDEKLFDKLKIENIENKLNELMPKKHIPLFKIGEIININGGRFMIKTIGKEGMFIKGLPR